MRLGILILVLAVALTGNTRGAMTLPMGTVFKGQDRFEQLVLLGCVGCYAFGVRPLGAFLVGAGVIARLSLLAVWVQERLQRPAAPARAGSSINPVT